MPSRTTLREIADLAGVSLSTVSQALNNRNGVSAETRARVLKAAASLGYRQPVLAATPVSGQFSTVGLIVKNDPNPFPMIDPFYYPVMQGVEQECERLNLSVVYGSMKVDENSHLVEWPALLKDQPLDGLIILGAVLSPNQAKEMADQRMVIVDGAAPGLDCDCVKADNLSGMYQATAYLIQQGHSEIGLIGGGARAHPSIRERRHGFEQAMHDYGLQPVVMVDSLISDPEQAIAPARAMLEDFPHLGAVVAVSDYVALGVMKAAHALGRRIPDNLSVIAFDNLHLSQHMIPALTTINVEKTYLGVLAVRQLYDRWVYPDRPPVTCLIGTQLVERESVQSKI
jgi:LacI family transcriptional regulator